MGGTFLCRCAVRTTRANPDRPPPGGIRSPGANLDLHPCGSVEGIHLPALHCTTKSAEASRQGNVLYVRDAADFVVRWHGTKAEAHAIKEARRGCLSTLGLTRSEDKTNVTHLTTRFDFLGYRVLRSLGTQGTMIPKGRVPAKAIQRFRAQVRAMLAPSPTQESTRATIHARHRLTRGGCASYSRTRSPSWVCSQRGTALFWDMAHGLGRKYASHRPAIMQRFRKDHTWSTKAIPLVMPTAYKAKKLVVKTGHHPYTAPEKVMQEKDRMQRARLFC